MGQSTGVTPDTSKPHSTPAPFAVPAAPDGRPVFVSPRVVDRAAFDDFAAGLRDLTTAAAQQARDLRAACDHAAEARAGLAELSAKHEPRIASALRALSGLDQRAAQAEQLLEAARHAGNALDTLRREADGLIERKLAEFAGAMQAAEEQARLRLQAVIDRAGLTIATAHEEAAGLEGRANGIVAGAASRLDAAESAMRQAVERHAAASEAPSARLEALLARAEAVLNGSTTPAPSPADALLPNELADAVEEAASERQELPDSPTGLEALVERATAAAAGLGRSLAGAEERLDVLRLASNDLRASVADAIGESDQARAELDARRDELATMMRGPLDALGPIVERAETARRTAQEAEAAVTELLKRASAVLNDLKPWRGLLLEGRGPDGRRTVPAPIRELIDEVRGELTSDLASIADAMRSITTRASGLADRVRAKQG